MGLPKRDVSTQSKSCGGMGVGEVVQTALTLIVATLLLLWPALYNGYPLVFDDTGTYVGMGVTLARNGWVELSWSRPPIYGLATAPAYLFSSLWVVIIAQSAIAASVLYLFVQIAFPKKGRGHFILLLAVASATTSLPWLSSWVMPDIYTGLVPLVLFMLYYLQPRLSVWAKVFLTAGGSFTMASHYSHFPLAAAIIVSFVFLGFFRTFRPTSVPRSLLWTSAPLGVALLALFLANAAGGKLQLFGPAGSIFLLARFTADGTALEYLHSNCPNPSIRLCEHLGELKADSNWLLWNTESPFNRIGILNLVEEARQIVSGSLRQDPIRHAVNAVESTYKQLISFDTGTGFEPFATDDNKSVTRIIRDYFPTEWPAYRNSRQARSALIPDWLPRLHGTVVIVSIIILMVRIRSLKEGRMTILLLSIGVLLTLTTNAFLAGTLSTVDDRYQSRVIWLLPFLAVLLWLDGTEQLRKTNPRISRRAT